MVKRNTKIIGDRGEVQASDFLKSLGFQIIDKNYRNRFGEIDIVVTEGETLVFVEVKLKKSDYFGTPAEMITQRKKLKLKNTALSYIQEKKYEGPWRVDAVLIEGEGIEHLVNIELEA